MRDHSGCLALSRRGVLLGTAGLAACTDLTLPASIIHFLAGAAAGGGRDAFARLVAKHVARLFDLRLNVENDGRAGGLLATERLARTRADGRTIGYLPPGALIYSALLSSTRASDALANFAWLGGVGADRRVLVVNRQSGLQTFHDLIGRPAPLIIASSAGTSPNFVEPQLLAYLTGTRIMAVPGYSGGARHLAFASGEVGGLVASYDSVAPLLEAPGTRILLRLNDLPLPDGQDAPLLSAFATGPDAAPLLDLISASAQLGAGFALPPGADDSLLSQWRDRLEAVIADVAFRQEAATRRFALELTPGSEVGSTLRRLTRENTPVTAALARALRRP